MKLAATAWFAVLVVLTAAPGGDARALQQAPRAAAAPRPADSALKARVEAALAAAADVPGKAIAVAVSGGIVTLTGVVATPSEQQSTGAIVRAVPGVKEVRFALRVEPPAPAGRGAPGGRGGRGGQPPAA